MEEAERLCDRIGIIDHGQLIAEGTRDDLAARPWVRQARVVDGSLDLSWTTPGASCPLS
jgi:ABC-2 type transport system ATP-binding protein